MPFYFLASSSTSFPSHQTIISGMGELHLEIYVERMKREYNVECTTGKPRVAFRETITRRADFFYTHKKQSGGAGQYARVIGFIEPMEMNEETGKDIEFVNQVMGGNIPSGYIPACEKVRITIPPTHTLLCQAHCFRWMLISHDRASTRPWRRAPYPATPSAARGSCSTTVSRTLSIRPNSRSGSRRSAPSAKCMAQRSRSSSSRS